MLMEQLMWKEQILFWFWIMPPKRLAIKNPNNKFKNKFSDPERFNYLSELKNEFTKSQSIGKYFSRTWSIFDVEIFRSQTWNN